MGTVETPDQIEFERWEEGILGSMCTIVGRPKRWSGEWCEWVDRTNCVGPVRCEICEAILPDNTYSLMLHGRWHIAQLPEDEVAAFQTLWLLCEGNASLVYEQWGAK